MTRLSASYAFCRQLTRRTAGNFYPAMLVLPRAKRRAMYALYAFNRLTDDIADAEGPPLSKQAELLRWKQTVDAGLMGEAAHPALPALKHAVDQFGIPVSHLHAVIAGCLMDTSPRPFATFADLYRYCTLVASAVGMACIHIWGFRGDKAPLYAEHAGVALQLTNILRDLGEDRERGRVYLPLEDLNRFGCDPVHIASAGTEQSFRSLMSFEVERTRGFYETARGLESCLLPAGRAIYRAILDTYRGLLDRIEAIDYDVFSQRVRLTPWKKLQLVGRALPLRWGWSLG